MNRNVLHCALVIILSAVYPIQAAAYGDPDVAGIQCSIKNANKGLFSNADCVRVGKIILDKNINEDWTLIAESEVSVNVGEVSWKKTGILRQYDRRTNTLKYIISQSALGKNQVRMVTVPVPTNK